MHKQLLIIIIKVCLIFVFIPSFRIYYKCSRPTYNHKFGHIMSMLERDKGPVSRPENSGVIFGCHNSLLSIALISGFPGGRPRGHPRGIEISYNQNLVKTRG